MEGKLGYSSLANTSGEGSEMGTESEATDRSEAKSSILKDHILKRKQKD